MEATPFPINNKYGNALKTQQLLEVAHVFSRLEFKILVFASAVVLKKVQIGAASDEEKGLLSDIEAARRDLVEIHSGASDFSATYLKDHKFSRFWEVAAALYRESFTSDADADNKELLKVMTSNATTLEDLAAPLPDVLRAAASAGVLDVVTRNAIGDKYAYLDDIVDALHTQTTGPRDLPSW
jgi:hypothetical protein